MTGSDLCLGFVVVHPARTVCSLSRYCMVKGKKKSFFKCVLKHKHSVNVYVYVFIKAFVCVCVPSAPHRKQAEGCWRLHKGAFEWLHSGKICSRCEGKNIHPGWVALLCEGDRSPIQGRQTDGRREPEDTHKRTNTHQSANREVWKAPSRKQGFPLNCSAFKPQNIEFSVLYFSFFNFYFVFQLEPGVFCTSWTEPLWFPLDPQGLERSEARLHATFPGYLRRRRGAERRLAPHRQLTGSHAEMHSQVTHDGSEPVQQGAPHGVRRGPHSFTPIGCKKTQKNHTQWLWINAFMEFYGK